MPTRPDNPTIDTEKRATLFVTTLTSFMGPFMISSVNIALPDIQKAFSVLFLIIIGGLGNLFGSLAGFAFMVLLPVAL